MRAASWMVAVTWCWLMARHSPAGDTATDAKVEEMVVAADALLTSTKLLREEASAQRSRFEIAAISLIPGEVALGWAEVLVGGGVRVSCTHLKRHAELLTALPLTSTIQTTTEPTANSRYWARRSFSYIRRSGALGVASWI